MVIPYHFKGITEIPFESVWYALSVALRYDVLRKPLGLHFTAQQLADEAAQHHIAYLENGEVVGILLLAPKENKIIKMRQVAVAEKAQGRGIGTKLVKYAESFAKEKGYTTIDVHARKTAVPFYLKMHYTQVGDEFEEVTIPHYRMVKRLS
jgi:predicted GNAT family N-acyltransferase